jgi:predicted RNA-binding Zn ribbon-like protein
MAATTHPDPPPSRAGVLPLIGGAPCLNFANTSSGRGTPLRQEHLHSFDLLLTWTEHAGLTTRTLRQRLSRLAAQHPRTAAHVLRRALALREAIHATGAALANAAPPPAPALAVINRELAAAMVQARLRPANGGFAWDWAAAPAALERVLWPLARSAADLLVAPLHARVKQCPGHGCGWIFLDLTKNGSRRWCEMEVCGTRHKIRRYRDRRRKLSRGGSKKEDHG